MEQKGRTDLGPVVHSVHGFPYREVTLLKQYGLTPKDLQEGKFPKRELCPCGKPLIPPDSPGKKFRRRCSDQCEREYDDKWEQYGRWVLTPHGSRHREPEVEAMGLIPDAVREGRQVHPDDLCQCGNLLPMAKNHVPKSKYCSKECMLEHQRQETLLNQELLNLTDQQLNALVPNLQCALERVLNPTDHNLHQLIGQEMVYLVQDADSGSIITVGYSDDFGRTAAEWYRKAKRTCGSGVIKGRNIKICMVAARSGFDGWAMERACALCWKPESWRQQAFKFKRK